MRNPRDGTKKGAMEIMNILLSICIVAFLLFIAVVLVCGHIKRNRERLEAAQGELEQKYCANHLGTEKIILIMSDEDRKEFNRCLDIQEETRSKIYGLYNFYSEHTGYQTDQISLRRDGRVIKF